MRSYTRWKMLQGLIKRFAIGAVIMGSLLAPAWGADMRSEMPVKIVASGVDPTTNEPRSFFYAQRPQTPFQVPDGFAFVIQDIIMIGQAEPKRLATEGSTIWVRMDDKPLYEARFIGPMQHASFTSGLVIPAGKDVSAMNWSFHSYLVEVQLLGCFVDLRGQNAGQPAL